VLADAIVAFSRMVLELGDRLVEAEINPLFVLGEGSGVLAADGLAVLLAEPGMDLMMGVCDVLYALDRGRVIASGPPFEVREVTRCRSSVVTAPV
jgi:hypothetical protein